MPVYGVCGCVYVLISYACKCMVCVGVCISRKGRVCACMWCLFKCCVGVCMAPGCCMSPAYVRVHNVGVCIAGSSVGKGVTEEERKRVCACMWCML